MDKNEAIKELLSRRLGITESGEESIYPSREEAEKKLEHSKGLRVYLGIDPTGPNLHLGHTVPLLFLKQLLQLGHVPVLLIGDFTARIGDPTGKDSTRKPLSEEEVREHMKNYLTQVYKILPKGSFEVVYNSEWLSTLKFQDVLELASHISVQQIITRSMFRERIKNNKPFGVHELLYPLMVGYDSVAMKIDGEVGGIDQTFNMLTGRDLEKKLLNKDKLVFATRLLVDAESGKKMSKTEGGLISLSDPPFEMFTKTLEAVPDSMIATVFELCTEKEMDWIEKNKPRMKSEPLEFKKELAFELVKMYHSEKEANEARSRREREVSNKEKPSEIEVSPSPPPNAADEILVELGLASSKSEARRLIEQGGVRINDMKVTDPKQELDLESGTIIQVGPRKFRKIE